MNNIINREEPDFDWDNYSISTYNKIKTDFPNDPSIKNITINNCIMKPNMDIKIKKTDKNNIQCTKCKNYDTITRSVQIRSVDEGETVIFFCNTCKNTKN